MIDAHLWPDALREEMKRCFGAGQATAKISEVEQLRAPIERLKKVNAQLREAGALLQEILTRAKRLTE